MIMPSLSILATQFHNPSPRQSIAIMNNIVQAIEQTITPSVTPAEDAWETPTIRQQRSGKGDAFPHGVRFKHLRFSEQIERLSGIQEVISSRGGITIAYELVSEENGELIYAFALARCHENDNYDRRAGRAKAGGRLNSPRYRRTVTVGSAGEFLEFLDIVGYELQADVQEEVDADIIQWGLGTVTTQLAAESIIPEAVPALV